MPTGTTRFLAYWRVELTLVGELATVQAPDGARLRSLGCGHDSRAKRQEATRRAAVAIQRADHIFPVDLVVGGARLTLASRSCATSSTSVVWPATPSLFQMVSTSVSTTQQNGHPVAIVAVSSRDCLIYHQR